ncbi:hypothetical protein [Zhongshania sp.]|uniref:hypothetical protein n=1 Tax=Zhongshania sp. TaxID=1971902 RepID=UPI001B4CF9C7|nr:hypothetical protein [Zhongshania sp.]MBQ0796631.1 hypothetical protein [Zhongshania sp.]
MIKDGEWLQFVVPRVCINELLATSNVHFIDERPHVTADAYDPEFDSPEARANFTVRNIRNLAKRRHARDKLIQQYNATTVVSMFPGRSCIQKDNND